MGSTSIEYSFQHVNLFHKCPRSVLLHIHSLHKGPRPSYGTKTCECLVQLKKMCLRYREEVGELAGQELFELALVQLVLVPVVPRVVVEDLDHGVHGSFQLARHLGQRMEDSGVIWGNTMTPSEQQEGTSSFTLGCSDKTPEEINVS